MVAVIFMRYTATLGPTDQPNGKVEVSILREHDLPGVLGLSGFKRSVADGSLAETRTAGLKGFRPTCRP